MSDFYVLKEGVPAETDLLTWAKWFEDINARRLRLTTVGDSDVSTVFMGIGLSLGLGPPLLWETMVLGGPLDGEQERYSTREAALAGHDAMAARVASEVLK